jgi:hypothetical protein
MSTSTKPGTGKGLKAAKTAAKKPSKPVVTKPFVAVAKTLTRDAERAKRYPLAAAKGAARKEVTALAKTRNGKSVARMSTDQFPDQAKAVAGALGAGRPNAAIFQREPGVFCYASKKAGLAKKWVFMGRAAALSQKAPAPTKKTTKPAKGAKVEPMLGA